MPFKQPYSLYIFLVSQFVGGPEAETLERREVSLCPGDGRQYRGTLRRITDINNNKDFINNYMCIVVQWG